MIGGRAGIFSTRRSVDIAQHLPARPLPPRLLVVEDARARRQHELLLTEGRFTQPITVTPTAFGGAFGINGVDAYRAGLDVTRRERTASPSRR